MVVLSAARQVGNRNAQPGLGVGGQVRGRREQRRAPDHWSGGALGEVPRHRTLRLLGEPSRSRVGLNELLMEEESMIVSVIR